MSDDAPVRIGYKGLLSPNPYRYALGFVVVLGIIVGVIVTHLFVQPLPGGDVQVVYFATALVFPVVGLRWASRMTVWVELGPQLRRRTLLGTQTAEWADVTIVSVKSIGHPLPPAAERSGRQVPQETAA